jgi:hypothetical protein
MNEMLKPLKQLANKHDTAICIVHHNKKSATDGNGPRAGNDMLGAVGLHAWVDCALYARSKNHQGEVAIEREAKAAQDSSFKVRIPTMFWHHSGDRQLWDPELVTEGLETEQAPVQEAHQERRKSGQAGAGITSKVKMIGGNNWVSFDQLLEIVDKSKGVLLKELTAAVDNGLLEEADGAYRYVRS